MDLHLRIQTHTHLNLHIQLHTHTYTHTGVLRRSYLGQLLLHSTQAWQRATHASRHAIMRAAASWARRLRLCLQRNTTALHWVTLQVRQMCEKRRIYWQIETYERARHDGIAMGNAAGAANVWKETCK